MVNHFLTRKSCLNILNLNLDRGILSPPEDSPIVNSTPEKKWPTPDVGGELILTSVRPEHALATARWTITDPNGREYGPNWRSQSTSKNRRRICSQVEMGKLDGQCRFYQSESAMVKC